jgi:hypothetical protein
MTRRSDWSATGSGRRRRDGGCLGQCCRVAEFHGLRVGHALEDARITLAARLADLGDDRADHIASL